MTTTPADVTFYELRQGTPDDPHPLILGRYLHLTDATAHGIDAFTARFGIADRLAWYPADDTETRHDLYATDLDDKVQTEWHVVTGVVRASYDPDAEG